MENLTETTAKQRRAIAALLQAWDTTAAAQAAGVSRETLYKWMALEPFKAELQHATAAALENLSRGLVTVGGRALAVLAAALDDQEAPTAAKIRAADIILSRLLQLRELVDLEARITALEENQVTK